MKTIFLDFETYYSTDYSLRRMNPCEYALDPCFEAIGAATIVDYEPAVWIDGPDLPSFFANINWQDAYVVSHNALFDMSVLKWRYGILPGKIGDTLAMARATIYGRTGSASLDACARHFGLPHKGKTIERMKGVDFATLTTMPDLYAEEVAYGKHDVWLCMTIYDLFMKLGFPEKQLDVIDMQCRMCVEPAFIFDTFVLAEHLAKVQSSKRALLEMTGLANKDALMSNDQFAALLTHYGVDPPMKLSRTTGKATWAFARTDAEFKSLLEHEKTEVQILTAARLGHKTTIEETRTESFLRLSHLNWQYERPKSAPIPLRYSGAWTHRFSGDWKLNMQNLPRKSKLRGALVAPPGMKVVSVDASQIEARIVATLCHQTDLVEAFRTGEDVYSTFASKLFNKEVKDKKSRERFVGKTAILSLGYGSSWTTFQSMVRNTSEETVSDAEAANTVNFYRQTYWKIPEAWRLLDGVIQHIPKKGPMVFECVYFSGGTMLLPNRMRMEYRDLRMEPDPWHPGRMRWMFTYGKQPKHLYGAKLLENITQALAFVFIMEVALKVKEMTGFRPAHQIHDELVFVVPEKAADLLMRIVRELMATPPNWLPGLPVAAEGGVGTNYGNAKE